MTAMWGIWFQGALDQLSAVEKLNPGFVAFATPGWLGGHDGADGDIHHHAYPTREEADAVTQHLAAQHNGLLEVRPLAAGQRYWDETNQRVEIATAHPSI